MDTQPIQHPLRVLRGCPSPEELAALTAVLMARAASVQAGPDDPARRQQAAALWQRPDRVVGFDGPRTWQSAPRPEAQAA